MTQDIQVAQGKQLMPQVLPRVFARSMLAMRPGLMAALKAAVASGDAPAAHGFFAAVAGPAAAAKLKGKDELAALNKWLSHQP